MAILTLDQSLSSTGFALLKAGGDTITGAWPLCDGIATRALGFRELFHRLDAMHKEHELHEIAHEAPILTRRDKVEKLVALYGLVAVIELYGTSRGIPVIQYPAKAWRGTFFSKEERRNIRGEDWKHPAILRCRQLGFDPTTDDEAEAIAILDHHLHKRKIKPEWRAQHPFLATVA